MNHLLKIHTIPWSENRNGHLMKIDLLVLLRKRKKSNHVILKKEEEKTTTKQGVIGHEWFHCYNNTLSWANFDSSQFQTIHYSTTTFLRVLKLLGQAFAYMEIWRTRLKEEGLNKGWLVIRDSNVGVYVACKNNMHMEYGLVFICANNLHMYTPTGTALISLKIRGWFWLQSGDGDRETSGSVERQDKMGDTTGQHHDTLGLIVLDSQGHIAAGWPAVRQISVLFHVCSQQGDTKHTHTHPHSPPPPPPTSLKIKSISKLY